MTMFQELQKQAADHEKRIAALENRQSEAINKPSITMNIDDFGSSTQAQEKKQ
jgi:hypothetical protein